MKWVSFISQTGREVYNIYIQTGVKPLFVVTNNINKVIPEVIRTFNVIQVSNRPTVDEYLNLNIPQDAIVTLNGWLRIVPKEITSKYKIYNGHPGLITEYPELKGLDPQIRAINGNYEYIGCVIHEVNEKLDDGKVLYHTKLKVDPNWTTDDYFKMFAKGMLRLWKEFFNNHINKNE